MSQSLTIDQAILLLSLFKAQNFDKTMGELFPERKEFRDVEIGELRFRISYKDIFLSARNHSHIMCDTQATRFETWNIINANWYQFDIFKFISLEDKV